MTNIRNATNIKLAIFAIFGLVLSLGFSNPVIASHNGQNQPSILFSNAIALQPEQAEDPLSKIEPLVLQQIDSEGKTDFFVWLKEKADLSMAATLQSKEAKGQYVFDTLEQLNQKSQAGIISFLDQIGAKYLTYTIVNRVFIRGGDRSLAIDMASRPEVERLTANHVYQLDPTEINGVSSDSNILLPDTPQGVGSNISFIKADQIWARGDTGQGLVLGDQDSGLQWDHPALKNHYRGWNGSTVNHNYNWWDATGTYPNDPGDGLGHGTHTAGIMVGDDGAGNQIGVAPGAKLIACKMFTDAGQSNDNYILTCLHWFLAPWDLNHANPNPAMRPDAINNSWGSAGGNYIAFVDAINNLQTAGIFVEVSAGNSGPNCQTLDSPGDYDNVLTTGSVSFSGAFPGTIAALSSRGPSKITPGSYTPDVMAPGEGIRSSYPGSSYVIRSGTSMAGPHVVGLVALLWSAQPALRHQVFATMDLIKTKAIPLTDQTASNCGGNYKTGPNNDWGTGTIDALATVANIVIVSGPINVDTTWIAGNTYYVTGDATVSNGKTLTIQSGAVVKFAGGKRLIISGKLLVKGTAAQPVYFTSYRDDAVGVDVDGTPGTSGSNGDWGWIEFTATSDPTSLIDNAIVRYGGYSSAGGGSRGNLLITDNSPIIQNSTIASSSSDGIYVNSTLSSPISHPTITACTLSANAGAMISIDPNSLLTLNGNVLPPPISNGTNGVAIRGGTISASVTWNQTNLPYRIIGDVTLANGKTLIIGPGMVFKLNSAAYFNARLIIAGKLTVNGTSSQPVYFTSYKDDSIPLVGGDTNGDGPTSGAGGDWGWIEFAASSDPTSLIDHAIIRFGGNSYNHGGQVGNLLITDASPTIQNSTVASSSSDGIYVNSTLSNPISHPTITACTLSANAGAMISIDPNSLLTLNGNVLPPPISNGTNGVAIRGGTISASVTWNQTNLPYRIIGDVTLANGKTLIIGPGMVFKLNSAAYFNARLIIAGKLTVNGTSSQPVYFTSYKDDSIPLVGGDTNGDGPTSGAGGDWGWIEFAASSDPTSLIDHAIIRFGGNSYNHGGQVGNLLVTDASPTIQNSTVASSNSDGIYVNSTLSNPISHPTITACTLSANAGAMISIDPNSLLTLNGNVLPPPISNGTNGVAIRGGTISASVTWNQTNLPYRIIGDVTLANGKTLIIGPGMVFKLNSAAYFNARLIIAGKLTVNGTSSQPVYFTSYKDDSIPLVGGDTNGDGPTSGAGGDWGWIEFAASSDPTSLIDHAIIRFGGNSYNHGGQVGNLLITDASPTIQNSTVASSSSDGIYVNSTLSNPISHPTITACTLSANAGAMISIDPNSLLTLNGNVLPPPISNGTNGVAIRGGTISASVTWNQTNLPYRIIGDVTLANGKTLIIGPGMVFKLNSAAYFNARLIIAGKLTVNGTSSQPVYFTSYKDDSIGGDTNGDNNSSGVPGDWGWIEFTPTSDPTSLINYAIIRFGGNSYGHGGQKGNIVFTNTSSTTIQNSLITQSIADGIWAQNSTPIFICNDIAYNNSLGLQNSTPGTIINATDLYWGSSSGPYHPTENSTGTGNGVSDGVNFKPWSPISCLGPPLPPTNLQASDGTSTDKVTLTWTSSLGASSYDVYRSDTVNDPKTRLGIISTPSFDDTTATPGILYYYWVTACHCNHCSNFGASNTGWRKLTPPTNLSATKGSYTDKIKLIWDVNPNATSYRVYRAVSVNGTKTLIGNPTQPFLDDTTGQPGTIYYYWVSACNGPRCSDLSNSDTGWKALTPPTNVQATDGSYFKVVVTWNGVLGFEYYEIYRSESIDGLKVYLGSANILLFNDTTPIESHTYYYWVKACKAGPVGCSDFSQSDTGWMSPPIQLYLPMVIKP